MVRVQSVAETTFQHADVITFEPVGKPLGFSEVLTELARWRERR